MAKQIMIWAFVLVFMAMTSYLVVADGTLIEDIENIIKETPIVDTTKTESIDLPLELNTIETKDEMNGYELSPIDCNKGSFHVYKEGALDRDITIDCNQAKNNGELKQLQQKALALEIEEYLKVEEGRNQVKTSDIRLERVRLVK